MWAELRSVFDVLPRCALAGNQYVFTAWSFLWAMNYVAAIRLLNSGSVEGELGWIVALIPSLVALATVAAYVLFLRNEMQRRIHLEGLAFGFGFGALFATGYHLLTLAGAAELDLDMVIVPLVAGMAVGQIRATKRFS